MATGTASDKAISLDTSDRQIKFVQGSDSSWALDLNTLVTIVFGVISIAFQAGQMYYARARQKVGPIQEDIENGRERIFARRQEAQFIMWRPQHNWNELEEYQAPETARGRPVPNVTSRGGAPRQVLRRDDGGQAGGTGHMPPGYVDRRIPWQNNDWERDSSPRLTPTGTGLERHYAPRQQPGPV
ncbi:hypothetical protein DHEL01_v203437 [Diaporthe helianthi]|uniref:Uncharacterized protein n=1 Tax=Diaporthe helianthi TaxID=158607 RepID=A0A2P5I6N6_DIAHE|nr:hypothetical protein DHEL01_v203437 [Diaporthe helianthi]